MGVAEAAPETINPVCGFQAGWKRRIGKIVSPINQWIMAETMVIGIVEMIRVLQAKGSIVEKPNANT